MVRQADAGADLVDKWRWRLYSENMGNGRVGVSKVAKESARGTFVRNLSDSGVVVSKTGGARRNPASIVSSETAKKQLDAVSRIKSKK